MKKITSIFGLHDQSKIYRYHEIRICDIDIVENSYNTTKGFEPNNMLIGVIVLIIKLRQFNHRILAL